MTTTDIIWVSTRVSRESLRSSSLVFLTKKVDSKLYQDIRPSLLTMGSRGLGVTKDDVEVKTPVCVLVQGLPDRGGVDETLGSCSVSRPLLRLLV